MRIGPETPGWSELRRVLTTLAADAGALYAYVLDSRGALWCSSNHVKQDDVSPAAQIVLDDLANLEPPLRRGGRLDHFAKRRAGHAYLRSFGGIYVLLLRFSAPQPIQTVRSAVAPVLPRIEALVADIPPPSGPGSEGAEGVGVA
ncbi:MAG: hypothetical protein GY788_04910 [bacterium]|nr:hypothetical protein [bacterium]